MVSAVESSEVLRLHAELPYGLAPLSNALGEIHRSSLNIRELSLMDHAWLGRGEGYTLSMLLDVHPSEIAAVERIRQKLFNLT